MKITIDTNAKTVRVEEASDMKALFNLLRKGIGEDLEDWEITAMPVIDTDPLMIDEYKRWEDSEVAATTSTNPRYVCNAAKNPYTITFDLSGLNNVESAEFVIFKK